MKNIINWQGNDFGLMFYKRAHERMKEMVRLQINYLDNNDVSARRKVIASLLTLPLLGGCYPQYFDLGWDEEVTLHDSTTIIAKFNFKHERRSRFTKHESAMIRDTTLSFEAGPPFGRVTQVFVRVQPMLLNKFEGNWYVVIRQWGGDSISKEATKQWGDSQSGYFEWPLKLTNTGFKSIPLAEFPDPINKLNLVAYLAPEEMAELNGQLLRMNGRKEGLMKYVRQLPQEDRKLNKRAYQKNKPIKIEASN